MQDKLFDALPDWIDQEAWGGFVEMRKSIYRVPFTDYAQRLIIKKLTVIRQAGHDPNASLEQSIERGWRGVFVARAEAIERAPSSAADQTRKMLDARPEPTKPPQSVIQLAQRMRKAG